MGSRATTWQLSPEVSSAIHYGDGFVAPCVKTRLSVKGCSLGFPPAANGVGFNGVSHDAVS